ncbi:MAG: patatin-like phospholipase family protein [Gemmatimonadaceae bacterium]
MKQPGRRGRAALSLAGVVLLNACAAIHRPPATIPSLLADAEAAKAGVRASLDSVVERLARRSLRRDTLDILLLSGGGQTGAYGAGFLRGWRERTSDPLPKFDLISGVSTGALQAPFVLLGTPQALDTLALLYRQSAERIAPSIDWFFWLRRTGGLVKADRLRRTIETVMDDTMATAMRGEFGAGRQLLIGTSDMDLGTQHAWDAADVLGTTAAGLADLHRVLLTSAAIPTIFPPVILDRHVHADGGVLGNIMPVLDLAQYEQLARRRQSMGDTTPLVVRVYLMLNIWPLAPPLVVKPSSRSAMSQRTLVTLFFSLQQQQIERLRLLAHVTSREVPGLRMELRVTYVPNAMATEDGAQALFNGPFIRRVEQFGYDRARGDAPWDIVERPAAPVGTGRN